MKQFEYLPAKIFPPLRDTGRGTIYYRPLAHILSIVPGIFPGRYFSPMINLPLAMEHSYKSKFPFIGKMDRVREKRNGKPYPKHPADGEAMLIRIQEIKKLKLLYDRCND